MFVFLRIAAHALLQIKPVYDECQTLHQELFQCPVGAPDALWQGGTHLHALRTRGLACFITAMRRMECRCCLGYR
jgi:hypothetical protein